MTLPVTFKAWRNGISTKAKNNPCLNIYRGDVTTVEEAACLAANEFNVNAVTVLDVDNDKYYEVWCSRGKYKVDDVDLLNDEDLVKMGIK